MTSDNASLSEVDRNFLWRRVFLNPFIFEGTPEALVRLRCIVIIAY